MWLADKWKDYRVVDCSCGEKLERWGKYFLVRPDPQVIWKTEKKAREWQNPDALYRRSSSGGGSWQINKLPPSFQIGYGNLKFNLKPMNFKHTGLFPEQAVNWDFSMNAIKNAGRKISVLNLFAYTGAASVACSAAGADVCHVDASKGMVAWAKENALLNGITNIRFIVDDCIKFVEREIRRGNHYDAIIMDPPSYGRGPKGEIWKIEESVFPFIELCSKILSDDPLFFLINSYTTGLQPAVLNYMINTAIVSKFGGHVEADEIGVNVSSNGLVLPCGASGRWSK